MIRFGLCCLFVDQPVRFRTATASSVLHMPRRQRLQKLSGICLSNAENLQLALELVDASGIGAFRISSGLLPLFTHPEAGYMLEELPDAGRITDSLSKSGSFAADRNIRLSFHPDQFVVLSSHRADVAANSAEELRYHGLLAEILGADVINIHLGGRHGGKEEAIRRFKKNFKRLPANLKQRLTLENDDISYAPSDLDRVCRELDMPMVYDVHHHRCNPDGLPVESATDLCLNSWKRLGREPYFHISSPKGGWKTRKPRSHSDYIDPADFPDYWRKLGCDFTLDVEAKAKELAVLRLMKDISE